MPPGGPFADATVVLWVLNFTTYVEKTRATTDSAGRFVITDNDSHNIRLAAEKPGVGRSARVPVRLYFRAQDIELREPSDALRRELNPVKQRRTVSLPRSKPGRTYSEQESKGTQQ